MSGLGFRLLAIQGLVFLGDWGLGLRVQDPSGSEHWGAGFTDKSLA